VNWINLSLASTGCFASAGMLNKFIISNYAKDSNAYVVSQILAQQIFIIPILLVFGIKFAYPTSLYAILLGAFYVIPSIYYFKAMQVEDVSSVIALEYLYIVFVFLGAAVFLGEALTPRYYLGGAALVVSVLLLSFRYSGKGSLPKASPAIKQFYVYWISTALYFLLLKYLLSTTGEWDIYTWTSVGNLIAILPMLRDGGLRTEISSFFRNGAPAIGSLLGEECFHFTGTMFSMSAYALGSVSLVTLIGTLEPFMTMITVAMLSRFWPGVLQEEINLQKIAAIVCLLIGIYFIY